MTFYATHFCYLNIGSRLPVAKYRIVCVAIGTRYKRRGVDEQGYCANYIETEQVRGFLHSLADLHYQISYSLSSNSAHYTM